MRNSEIEKILEKTEEKIFNIDTDIFREIGLGNIADKIDDIYYDLNTLLMEYSFEDEEEE